MQDPLTFSAREAGRFRQISAGYGEFSLLHKCVWLMGYPFALCKCTLASETVRIRRLRTAIDGTPLCHAAI